MVEEIKNIENHNILFQNNLISPLEYFDKICKKYNSELYFNNNVEICNFFETFDTEFIINVKYKTIHILEYLIKNQDSENYSDFLKKAIKHSNNRILINQCFYKLFDYPTNKINEDILKLFLDHNLLDLGYEIGYSSYDKDYVFRKILRDKIDFNLEKSQDILDMILEHNYFTHNQKLCNDISKCLSNNKTYK
jgi:hypothetical protein